MPSGDLLHALPGVVTIGVLSGFALATLVAPRWVWWERLAMAPGMAAGLAGLLGLIDHDLSIAYEPASVFPLIAFIAVAAWVRWSRCRRASAGANTTSHISRASTIAVVCTALTSGAVALGIASVGLSAEPLPASDDGAVHALVAERVAQTHDTLPLLPEPADSATYVRPRTGFEAAAALSSSLGGPTPTRTMLPLALASVVLLPLGLASLALETAGAPRIAMLASVAGVGAVLPLFPLGFAEFPLVADSTLVAPLLVAAVRLVRGRSIVDATLALAMIVAAIWVVHGLEVLTALVIATPLVAGVLLAQPDKAGALRHVALGVTAAVAAAVAVTLLTRLPAVTPPLAGVAPVGGPEAEHSVASAPGVGIDAVVNVIRGSDLAGTFGQLLFAAGCVAAIVLRRLRWALVATLVFAAALFDVSHSAWLHGLWVKLYPWGVIDRLVSVQYWTAAILIALGADTLITAVESTVGRVRTSPSVTTGRVLTAASGVVLLVVGGSQTARIFGGVVADRSRVTAADISLFETMSQRIPSGRVVLTDGEDDAGIWVAVMTPDTQYLDKSWMSDHPDDFRVVALERACEDPVTARRALVGMDVIVVGSKRWRSATHPWDLGCIARLPGLSPVASATDGDRTATAFAVIH